MSKLDKALLEFVKRTDGQVPRKIYMGYDILKDVMLGNGWIKIDKVHMCYEGIPFFIVQQDHDHLEIY